MKDMMRLTDHTTDDLYRIFKIADRIKQGEYKHYLEGKTVVLFFPNTSIRTRVTFEKGIYLLGGQAILFPTETLDKKEALEDVCGYLDNWADMVIVRHHNISVLETMAQHLSVPVINAMTDINHPCEILSDLYALFKRRADFEKDHYLFCGMKGNIGLAWQEAAKAFGLNLEQCCGKGYEIEGLNAYYHIEEAVIGKNIICTDSVTKEARDDFRNCQVTTEIMKRAQREALLNPCPPFYRGEEVSDEVIRSKYFVGYDFKRCLLEVQQAIMIYCLEQSF